MAFRPQNPKANAPFTSAMEPAIRMEAAESEPELPVPATEPLIRPQDRLMPIANVIRIMRRMLPPHAKVADDAKEVIQECVSEFISFVTGEANDRCQSEHRKTVTAEDILWAMQRLGFDDYDAALKVYLQRMRDYEGRGRGDCAYQVAAPDAPPPVPMCAVHGQQARPLALPTATLARGHGVVPHHVLLGGERSMAASSHGDPGSGWAGAATIPRPRYPY